MKKNRLIAFFVIFSFIGISFVNCDDGDTPVDEDIRVTSVKIDDGLKKGLTIQVGSEVVDIAGKVTVLPENATNKKILYSSSNTTVATITQEGKITILAAGTTTITVTADEKSDNFILTVTIEEPVKVSEIQLETNTLELTVGESANIADMVTVLPEDAANKSVTYESGDDTIAEVDKNGNITAKGAGTVMITVASEDVPSVKNTISVTVKAVEPIKVSEIQLETNTLELTAGESVNIADMVTVLPENAANKSVTYESGDDTIAEIDENGNITAKGAGTVTITVASVDVPSVKNTISVTVTEEEEEEEFTGDYPRGEWAVIASQDPFTGEGNSLTGAIDGDPETMLALVRPSKSFRGITVPSAANGGYISFVIDMKKPQKVNYFRLLHRNTTQVFLRYMMFEEISGSNDGENFTTIATDVEVTDAGIAEKGESPNIAVPLSEYRYLKFYCQKNECFLSMSSGVSAQIREIYLGYELEE